MESAKRSDMAKIRTCGRIFDDRKLWVSGSFVLDDEESKIVLKYDGRTHGKAIRHLRRSGVGESREGVESGALGRQGFGRTVSRCSVRSILVLCDEVAMYFLVSTLLCSRLPERYLTSNRLYVCRELTDANGPAWRVAIDTLHELRLSGVDGGRCHAEPLLAHPKPGIDCVMVSTISVGPMGHPVRHLCSLGSTCVRNCVHPKSRAFGTARLL